MRHSTSTSQVVYLIPSTDSPRSHGLRRLSYDAPALDLTGMIAKLDNHYFKPGGFSDVYRSRYTSTDGVKEVRDATFAVDVTLQL